MKMILPIFAHLALFIGSLFLAYQRYTSVYLIPIEIISFSPVHVRWEDWQWIATTYSLITFFIFSAIGYRYKDQPTYSHQRIIDQLFATLFVSTFGASFLFAASEIHFSPNFFVHFIFYVNTGAVALAAIFCFFHYVSNKMAFHPLEDISVFKAFFRRTFSILGILVLTVAITPGLLALLYKKDRSFANYVNSFKRTVNSERSVSYQLQPVYPGLTFRQPIDVDFSQRFGTFLLERPGRLFRLTKEKKHLLIDISSAVGVAQVENGALGFALHPEFDTEGSQNFGRLFLYYTHSSPQGLRVRLSEFQISLEELQSTSTTGTAAATEKLLIDQGRNSEGFHNGGGVEFGPDGYLYLSIGEVGTPEVHQRIDVSFFGGVFRIDIDNRNENLAISRQPQNGVTQGYRIPKDNPFVSVSGALQEFYALGLRNPFRIRFDRETGKLWAGEVGSNRFEEVNHIVAGGNYQFPFGEGVQVGPQPTNMVGESLAPQFFYEHTALDRAIIGGEVYRGTQFKDLYGQYVFADNYSGRVWAIDISRKDPERQLIALSPHLGQMGVSSVVANSEGDIFVTTLGQSHVDNGLFLKLASRDPNQESPNLASQQRVSDTSIEATSRFYANNCVRCHGLNGEGHPETKHLNVAKFTDPTWQKSVSNESIAEIIKKGGQAVGKNPAMPPWSAILSDEEVMAMVKHIRSLEKPSPQ